MTAPVMRTVTSARGTFGTPLGGGTGAEYNQVIGSGHYYLQQEWPNHNSGCVLTGI
jgi:hypothetical protein